MNIKILILLFFVCPVISQEVIFFPGTISTTAPESDDLADIHYFFENNAADSSGNGNDASPTDMSYGSATPAQGSNYGDFSSDDAIFQVPSGYTLGTPFSISLWYRQNSSGGYYEMADPNRENSNYEYWFYWLDGVAYDIEFRGYQNSTNNLSIARTNNSVWSSEYVWHHLVLTYDNGTVEFYLDGSSLTMSDATTWDTDDMKLDGTINIGRSSSMHIDDWSIYDFKLSSGQVTTLYNSGTAGTILTE